MHKNETLDDFAMGYTPIAFVTTINNNCGVDDLCLSTASRRRRRCKGRSTSPPADADLHCLDMASSSGVVRSKSRVLWQGEEPSWKDPCSLLPRSPPPTQPNQRAPPGWGELGGCGRSNFGVFVNRGEPGTQAGRCTLIRHV